MGIADLKMRLRDVPGIETLTMTMEAGKQNHNLNGRVIALDASASDFQVEQAIRAAMMSAAISQMPIAPDPATLHGLAAVETAINARMANAPAPTSSASLIPAVTVAPPAAPTIRHVSKPAMTNPASAGQTVKQMMEDHTRMMAEIHATQAELLRVALARQRDAVSAAVTSVAGKIDGQTDDFLSIMGQFTNEI